MKKVLLGSITLASILLAEDSVYDLGRIEVVDTADISQNKTSEYVDREDISNSNSKDVVQALKMIPGISALKVGRKNLTEVRVRGFNNKRVPLYVDGIPVYIPYNRETDLGRFTTYDLGEISVSKAYVSPMYGPNTIGGAINLVTRKPKNKLEGEVGGSIFSGNGHEEFLSLGTNQGNFYGILSVSNFQRDYMEMSNDFEPKGQEDGGRRENSDSKDFKLNLKVGYTPNNTDEYSFNYVMQRAKKGNPFYASDYESGDEGYRKNFRIRYWRWPDWDKTSYYFITKTQATDNILIKSRWFYDKFFNRLEDLGKLPNAKNNPKLRWASEYDDYSIGGNIETNFKLHDNHKLKFALFQKNDYHKQYDPNEANSDLKTEGYTQSLGAEYAWKINDKLTWVLGVAYDRYKTTLAEYEIKGENKSKGKWEDQKSDIFSPQTILYYQATKDTLLYGSVGRRSNMPSLSQRFSTRFGGYIPNPNLDAEIATNYEIGIEQSLFNDHLLKAAIFYTKTDDYIGTVNVEPIDGICGGDCEQNQNIGQEEHKGFELSINSYWMDNLTTNLSYSYIDSKLKKSESDTAKYITGIPKHAFNMLVTYEPINGLFIMPLFRYESSRYVDNEASSPKTKPFFTMDLKMAYRFKNGLELNAGIKNITDKNYYYSEGFPEEGRTYYAGIRYLF